MGIVDIALSQEGVSEQGINNVMYNTWYWGHEVSGGQYPWCAVFVSWCADQAGCSKQVYQNESTGETKTASVSSLYNFYSKNGLFQPKGNGYRPKAGDIMIQKSGGASHVGIVYASDNDKFYTIEGNSSNKVQKCSYYYDDPKLTGFGTPNYDGSAMSGSVSSDDYSNTGTGSSSGASLGVGQYDYTAYTVKSGDTLDKIAKKYNCTPAMIIFLNNLKTTELTKGQVLQVPTIKRENGFDPVSGVGSITKKHTSSVVVSHPTIEVEFYGEYGKLASKSTTGLTSATDVDNDIISVSTTRSMGQDCPTFTINLTWRRNWYTTLASNDLILIRMQRPPEVIATIFFGLIDDIRKVTDFSSGQPQRSVQVTGRGLAKAFVNFDVGLIKNVSIDTGTGFFAGLLDLVDCDSYDAIKAVIDSYVGKAIKYSFGNGKLFENYFVYSGNHHSYEKLVDYTSYTSYNGSLWNFIKELGNAPFNETYWEVVNNKPNLVHRRTPFNKKDWLLLPRITIKDMDIVSDNTGRSDLETYTLFSVQMSVGEIDNVYPPLWYPPFYAKYGLTQLSVDTSYQILYEDTDSAVGEFFKELFNFNIKNNIFSNGTIVVKGSNRYKVGQRIIMESENLEYYVESVSHSFSCYGSWTTSLSVTRGIEPENRFTPPWGCAEEMTPDIMNAIVSQTSGEEINWSNLPKYTVSMKPHDSAIDPSEWTSSNRGSSGTPTENETKVYNTLKGWGLNTAACSAVLANINDESGFDTTTWGDNHTSLGLCQWHNSRCTALQNFCKSNGYNLFSVEGQMAYLKTELENSYKTTWNKLNSVPDSPDGAYAAAYTWCIDFERPKYKEVKGQERGNVAKNTYFPRYS